MKKKKIYIMYSYTGTVLSKIIRVFTHEKYAHVSISIDKKLKKVYSFGRQNPRWMFPCGFAIEDIHLISQVCKNTKCQLYELEISQHSYYKLKRNLKKYIKNKNSYHYNIKGLLHINFNRIYQRDSHFVCSQFIGKLFIDSEICEFDKDYSILKPKDIVTIPNMNLLYEGKIIDLINQLEKDNTNIFKDKNKKIF